MIHARPAVTIWDQHAQKAKLAQTGYRLGREGMVNIPFCGIGFEFILGELTRGIAHHDLMIFQPHGGTYPFTWAKAPAMRSDKSIQPGLKPLNKFFFGIIILPKNAFFHAVPPPMQVKVPGIDPILDERKGH